MPIIDSKKRESKFRVVYHGPGLAGRTTNLAYVFERMNTNPKVTFISLYMSNARASGGRQLSFDFLPKSIAPIDSNAVRIELITGPGALYKDPTRRLILAGVDGVVFVADSQEERTEANKESMEELVEYLGSHDISIEPLPLAVQFNKRDLPNAAPVADLARDLNPRGRPQFEAVARTGVGVFDTLKAVAKEMLTRGSLHPLAGRPAPYRD